MSVNGKTGAVTLTKGDVGLSQVANVKQYSAQNPPPYPVTSVNGQTGAVILSASDIGAQSTITVNGILKGDGAGGIEAATPGVDYEEAPFMIHFTTDNLDENIISSDKSGAQIESAFNAGSRVEAFLDGKQLGSANTISNGRGYDFVDITANGNIRGVRLSIEDGDMLSGGGKTYSFLPVDFSCVERPAFSGVNELWGTDADGFWGLISNIDLSNLPAVSAADNGKFLRVVNGAWAIVSISDAHGGSF